MKHSCLFTCLPHLFDPHLRALFIQFFGGSPRESISRVSIATLPRVFTLICAVFFFTHLVF